MSLTAGSKLGPYEILGPIGAGGMGEVYRARDPRLNRDVAIKTSAARFTERFEREAKAIAALNHPNICQVYDVGPDYLVMEYIEGDSPHGPLPLDETLRIMHQIADALEAAHEKGITHRDLKPGNIKIKPDGTVKVLDFGLAKVNAPPSSSGENSPTLTVGMTQAGMVLGTAAYMSPEQARGKESVDRRADIWAFGVVFYELLTGRRLFEGEDTSSTLAAVIMREPDLAGVPPQVATLLKRCLEKDPKKRLRDIGDAWALLSSETPAAPAPPPSAPLRSARLPWIAAAIFALAAALALYAPWRAKPPAPQSLRFQVQTPGNASAIFPILSPDGRRLAFVTSHDGPDQIWVRDLDAFEARALPGTDGATYPFWSPDGASVAFFAEGKLRKIAVAGGPPQTLCDAGSGRGGTWNREGVILFSNGPDSPILRVPAAGGSPVPVSRIAGGAAGHRFPFFLPDGVHFLYNAGSDKPEEAGVFVASIEGGNPVRLLPDMSSALYSPGPSGGAGHLLFRREETLMAQPFDARSLKTTGEMFPVAEQVLTSANIGSGAFFVSDNGALAYISGGAAPARELVWMDRAGKRLGVLGKPGAYLAMEVSPDDKTLAVMIGTASQSDIWLEDISRGVLSRFTFRSGISRAPVWSPDGSHLLYGFLTSGGYAGQLLQKAAGGNSPEELLLQAGINGYPNDWSSDGKWIVYRRDEAKTAADLWLLPMSGDRKPTPYLQTPFAETNGRFSPDARWLAYQSNESGTSQVYVQSVPPNGSKYQVSSNGGSQPQWRRDGKELYYISSDRKLMAVPIKLGDTVEAGAPEALFPVSPVSTAFAVGFSVSPARDGQRFLVNVPVGGDAAVVAPINIVTNWQSVLKK